MFFHSWEEICHYFFALNVTSLHFFMYSFSFLFFFLSLSLFFFFFFFFFFTSFLFKVIDLYSVK